MIDDLGQNVDVPWFVELSKAIENIAPKEGNDRLYHIIMLDNNDVSGSVMSRSNMSLKQTRGILKAILRKIEKMA